MGQHYLDYLFAPHAIAVFGASLQPKSVGTRLFQNIIEGGFTGPVYPINPKYKKLDRKTCYSSIRAIGKPVDLAVIATPAATVSEIIHECGEYGVRAAIILLYGRLPVWQAIFRVLLKTKIGCSLISGLAAD